LKIHDSLTNTSHLIDLPYANLCYQPLTLGYSAHAQASLVYSHQPGALALFASALSQADAPTSIRSPEWAQPVGDQYNLYQMTPTLYRSALPDSRQCRCWKTSRSARSSILLPESDNNWLKAPSIRQVQLVYRTNHVDDSDVLAALRAIKEAEANGAVLMHCKHGSDRTGLMAAMYRVVVQGWSKEEALNEMTLGGFGSSNGFKDGVRYMMKADIDKLAHRAGQRRLQH
jgi:protein tyrosine/serine phosphatase